MHVAVLCAFFVVIAPDLFDPFFPYFPFVFFIVTTIIFVVSISFLTFIVEYPSWYFLFVNFAPPYITSSGILSTLEPRVGALVVHVAKLHILI